MASNVKTLQEKMLVNGKQPIDFFGKRKIFFTISLVIIALGLICNIIFGTTLDIQFTGGSMIKYTYSGDVSVSELEYMVQTATPDHQVTFSHSSDFNGTQKITVQFSGNEAISTDVIDSLTNDIKTKYPDSNFVLEEQSSVDATMGTSFLFKCLTAILIAGVLMVLYVTFRFRKIGGLSAGVFGLVALVHDVFVIYSFYVIFGLPIDSNFIAVALMILGYSLNDTVVIYDRIREERKLLGIKADIVDVFNVSLTKVIRRTIITTITTIVVILTVYSVAVVFNLDSVKGFALPMIVGLVSGSYSSICICGPLWVMWQQHKAKKA